MAAKTQFDYLLNAMERAAQSENPAGHGYAEKRAAVLLYVRGLESVRDQVVTLGVSASAAARRPEEGAAHE